MLPQLDAKIPASGSGLSSDDPPKVVFLVTDGVSDTVASTHPDTVAGASSFPGGDRLIEAFNPTLCAAMKARGVKMAVIYTTFQPLPTNTFYTHWVQPWQDEINPNIKRVAVIFNPGDTASQFGMQRIRKYAAELGLELIDEADDRLLEVLVARHGPGRGDRRREARDLPRGSRRAAGARGREIGSPAEAPRQHLEAVVDNGSRRGS